MTSFPYSCYPPLMLDNYILNRVQGWKTMNMLAGKGTPFFFMTDAWNTRWIVLEPDKADRIGIKWSLNRNLLPACKITPPAVFRFEPVDYITYRTAFNIIRQAQTDGETWLANLTFPARLQTDISLYDMFAQASAKYRLHIPDTLTVFSPEQFVRIDSAGRIACHPMKGTISLNGMSLTEAKKRILEDTKETAEHVTIVDLIRNDLGMVSNQINVPRFRYITEVETGGSRLLQVSSEISGQLDEGWQSRLGVIIDALLPVGSVTGAPKKRTCEILRRAEGLAEKNDRGWYTGVFGCFDGQELDSAVAIRFVRQDIDGNLYYHSGGGITIYSNVEKEYDELIRKIYVPITGNNSCR